MDKDGSIVGRALWWGRDVHVPLALDVWDARHDHPEEERLLSELLARGHAALASEGVDVPLPHTMRVPTAWRDVESVHRDIAVKAKVAATAGLVRTNERRQFQWDADAAVPTNAHRLRFEAADDDTFVRLFARAARDSLDVMTRRGLATTDAEGLARYEIDYYRSCPGDRGWWRVAHDRADEVVGIAIPSATPTSRNVGYLAVLPEHRGLGYVDDIPLADSGHHTSPQVGGNSLASPQITSKLDINCRDAAKTAPCRAAHFAEIGSSGGVAQSPCAALRRGLR